MSKDLGNRIVSKSSGALEREARVAVALQRRRERIENASMAAAWVTGAVSELASARMFLMRCGLPEHPIHKDIEHAERECRRALTNLETFKKNLPL